MRERDLILTDILDCSPIDLYTKRVGLTAAQEKKLDFILKKRAQGIPLQHLLGRTYFYNLPFLVKESVFIPRFETEILVEKAIELSGDYKNSEKIDILDICSGSGNISISLAHNIKNSQVTAIDINKKAIELSEKNACLNHVDGKINFLCEDVFKLKELNRRFDIIVSNPPYLRDEEVFNLSEEVLHEPKESLFAGDGLRFFRHVLKIAPDLLKQEAYIIFEIGHDQAEQLRKISFLNKCFTFYEMIKDYCGFDRVVVIRYRKKNG